jgi:hypothetical protein
MEPMITIKKLAASAALAVGATAIEVSGAGAASANTAEEQQFMSGCIGMRIRA